MTASVRFTDPAVSATRDEDRVLRSEVELLRAEGSAGWVGAPPPAGLKGPSQWPLAVILVVGALQFVALVLATFSWYESGRQLDVRRQIPWANAAVIAVMVSGAGHGLWILAARRAVTVRSHSLADRARRVVLDAAARPPDDAAGLGRVPTRTGYVTSAGATMYHRSDCPMMADRLQIAHHAGSTPLPPCGWCRP